MALYQLPILTEEVSFSPGFEDYTLVGSPFYLDLPEDGDYMEAVQGSGTGASIPSLYLQLYTAVGLDGPTNDILIAYRVWASTPGQLLNIYISPGDGKTYYARRNPGDDIGILLPGGWQEETLSLNLNFVSISTGLPPTEFDKSNFFFGDTYAGIAVNPFPYSTGTPDSGDAVAGGIVRYDYLNFTVETIDAGDTIPVRKTQRVDTRSLFSFVGDPNSQQRALRPRPGEGGGGTS